MEEGQRLLLQNEKDSVEEFEVFGQVVQLRKISSKILLEMQLQLT